MTVHTLADEYRHMNKPTLGPSEHRLLDLLSSAQEPLTKPRLMIEMGMTERSIRHSMEVLRRNGYTILSSGRTAGFWISHDPQEIRDYVEREITSRIRSLSDQRRRLLEAAAELDTPTYQESLPEGEAA